MRDFCKFSPKFWMCAQTRRLVKEGPDTILVALYLQTNHHSHSLGIYFIPLIYIARDTGITLERVQEIINQLEQLEFCQYDAEHEYIWLLNYGLDQVGGPLKKVDNRVIQLQKYFEQLPSLSFLGAFYHQHKDDFHLLTPPKELERAKKYQTKRKKMINDSLQGTQEALASKEKNKEKEKEKNKETEKVHFVENPVDEVFSYWKQIMNHPNAKLDKKRKIIIQGALKSGYEVEQLCQAITGCSYTAHNMGENERGERYDGLHVILRDANQIDRFIGNYLNPPKKLSACEHQAKQSYQALETWFQGEEEGCGNH